MLARQFLIKKREENSFEEDGRKVFSMSKERNCPICGLKMKRLAFQLWQCKCMHREKGRDGEEEEGEEDLEKRLRFGVEKEGRFSEQAHPSNKGLMKP